MTELFKNAWMGWQKFTSGGKLPAFLLAALLFLWLCGKWKKQKALYVYTAVAAFCSIIPITAAVLMLYQTKFYDYQWTWSLVPMTVVAAWGVTEFLIQRWEDPDWTQESKLWGGALLLLAALVLSSGLGDVGYDRGAESCSRQNAIAVLESAVPQEGEVYLWAPREILEYAREWDGSIRLLYGRNMWEEALNAYSEDVYSQEIRELYLWMENVEADGSAVAENMEEKELNLVGEACMAVAEDAGVNCVLLPDHVEQGTVEQLAAVLGGSVSRLDGYYLLTR